MKVETTILRAPFAEQNHSRVHDVASSLRHAAASHLVGVRFTC
jgi:hypothetical protein